MLNARKLLIDLDIRNYMPKHIKVIEEFISNEETDIERLLDKLGSWDSFDLKIAKRWLEENK